MKALVVHDSVFGNTEQVAQAIGSSLGYREDIEILRVGNMTPERLTGVKLLIVGSPTRGFRPTEGITNFLKGIPSDGLEGVRVAAFDTRLSTADIESPAIRFIVKTGGYAAKRIAKRLKKSGGELMMPPEGFFVEGTEGPLKEGELERAAEWAQRIVASQSEQRKGE